jgi:hypothetical protein
MRMPDCRAAKTISGSWGDGSARSHLFIAPRKRGGRMRSDQTSIEITCFPPLEGVRRRNLHFIARVR